MSQNKPKKTQSQHVPPRINGLAVAQVQRHEGPIPDPDTLARYESISPGFAERIMKMAELEQSQRHSNDATIIRNQHIQHKRDTLSFRLGQLYAILSVGGVILLCAFLANIGCSVAAGSIGVATIVGVVVAFHNRNPEKNKENTKNVNSQAN